MKYFLTIAASDNSGGAGVQQDIKVAWDLGYWPLSAVTGITVQNFTRARMIEPVSSDLLYEQIAESLESFPVNTVKIGALTGVENMRAVVRVLRRFEPRPVVLDPVIATSSGKPFLSRESIKELATDLIPLTTVITPNAIELGLLCGVKITSFEQAVEIAQHKAKEWNTNIVVKGGHFNDAPVREAVVTGDSVKFFTHERLDFSRYSHGTGCTFSSALACYLADGYSLSDAYGKATDYLVRFYQRMQEEV